MKFNIKYLWALIPILIVGGVLYYLSDIVTYILLAWVISMIGNPVVAFLRKYVGRNAAAVLTLSMFIGVLALVVWVFLPPLVNQVENLSKVDYGKAFTALEEPIRDWEKWLVSKKLMLATDSTLVSDSQNETASGQVITHRIEPDSTSGDSLALQPINIHIHLDANENNQPQNVREAESTDGFFKLLKENMVKYLDPGKIQAIFGNTLNAFGNLMIGIFSIFFIGFFFLREQGLFDSMLTSMVPTSYEQQTKQALDETTRLLIRYFAGILIQVTIITVIISSTLAILGVKNALLIGFFAGILNVIPYVGPMIATALALLITLSSNIELTFYDEMVPLLIKVLIVFAVTRLIDDFILQPNIFSKSVKAHPLEIFIIVLVGAKIGGVFGMILAIPFYTAFRVIGKVFLSEFKVIQRLTRNM